MKQPDACIVRITDAQGKTRGTGFLVSTDGLVVTCAHVVRGTEPCVAFPGSEPRPAHVMATDEAHDVIILRVEGELPPGTALARLGRSARAHYCDFRSRGYRPMEGLEGIPAEGRVLDAVSEAPGYPGVRHMPLILQTQHAREGMSGAPVYVPDLDLVVGMITGYWDSLIANTGFPDRDTALATPAEAIAALCPDISLVEPSLSGLVHATRIQNFRTEYLGTPEQPVPFGGREAALATLDSWLADPAAPHYLLLAAPAGRGKSALLVRWLERLQGRDGSPAVAFVPVSIRFRTNLASVVFATLAVRLAHLHGEEVTADNMSADNWRAMVSNYLARSLPDGRRLLVVLDGADEADDWEPGSDLFPLTPPPGLRVVLSTRYRAGDSDAAPWLRRLGWERPGLAHPLELDPLTPEGVADVLTRMGFPLDRLGAQADIVAELHRLSAGGPLLVRLYVDDLLARGEEAAQLQPEDLRSIQPELAGYFSRWWEDQRRLWGKEAPLKEPAVQAVLNLLACALGPLARADVLALAGDCNLTTWTLEEALRPLARFIIGDGERQGYVFQHPKLGEYFYGRLTPGERQAWEDRFLAWGKETLETLEAGTLLPHAAPTYVVQYYSAHLYARRDVESCCQDLYALVESQSWTTVKYVNTPWAGSLIQDLQLASDAAAEGNVEDWARAMGYQLRRALIEQLMSRRTILFLVRLGEVERALDLARRQEDRFELLREIARAIASTQPGKAADILAESAHLHDNRSASESCTARLAAAQEILRLVPSYQHVALDLIEEARRLEYAIPESDMVKYSVMWKLPTLALSGKSSAAMAASSSLPLLQQAQALRQISLALPQDHTSRQNLLEQALSILEALEQTPEVASEKMKALVALLPLVGEDERRGLLNSLESAGDYLCSVEAPVEYIATPHWAVGHVAQIDLGWARRMLLESKWSSTPDVLYEVVQEIAHVDYEEALQIVRDRLSNHILTPQLLVHIIGIVAAKDTDRAEALIEEYAKQLGDDKDDAHIAVAEAYLVRGDAQKARQIFREHAVRSNSESLAHARGDLQLAILGRSRDFLSAEAARDRLMQFPVCPRCHESREKDAEVLLARMAARQNRLDILKQHRFGRDARLAAAYDLADCAGPDVAREYLQSQHIDSFAGGAEGVYAHIAAVEAQRDPAKLEVLLEEHFNGNAQPHHFCPYMREWPYALRKAVETGRIEPTQAMSLIERLYPLLMDWECPRKDQPREQESWKVRCDCYDYSEGILAQLIGVMALVDPERSEEMVNALPAQPIRVYALKQILYHTQPHEALVHRIITACQECIADPWQRASSYYLLAISLPVEVAGIIERLIKLAEPLLSEPPIEYYTNRLGIPIRVGPSSTELSIRKAQALMKLVGNVSQFAHVAESLRVIDSLVQLDDKLRVLDLLAEQARDWPDEDRLTLLWRVWKTAATRKLLDVEVLIAALVPIVHSLGGEEAFWRLQHYIEWAYQGLLPGSSSAVRAHPR